MDSCSSYLVKHLLCGDVGRYYMKWICVNWLCHRKSFSGHWCIFVVLGFYSLMYDGILQMFPFIF